MIKKAIIISGPNGSGKTTFAKNYIRYHQISFINADEIESDIVKKDEKRPISAGKIFLKQIHNKINKGDSIIIESTLSGKYMIRILEKLKSRNYEIEIIFLFLDNSDLCINRIIGRVLKGGHHIPDFDVRRRFLRSIENFWNIYKNLADKWFLVYNSEQEFIEFVIGEKDNYQILNERLFGFFKDNIGNI